MESIASHNNYRDILREELATRCQANSRYSLRAFARDLGVSHSYISQVLSGKLRLSFRQALRFSEFLDLEEATRENLLKGIMKEKETSLEEGKPVDETCAFYILEIDRL